MDNNMDIQKKSSRRVFGKRELITSVLIAALGAAVFLNWQLDPRTGTESVPDEDLGAAHYVNASISTRDTASKKTENSDSSANNTSSQPSETEEYFSRVRLDRRKTQDELVSLARSVAESDSTSGEAKTQAVKTLDGLLTLIDQQTSVEGLIIAKGFDDCIAYIQNGECSIVVTGQELRSDTLTAIKDIVKGQTGISFDKIRVTQI